MELTVNSMTVEKVTALMRECAAKAGVSVEGVTVEPCTLEATWGDRCGYYFGGGSNEVNKRAAEWFLKLLRKLPYEGSYGAQRAIGNAAEPFTKSVCSNGAKHHFRGHTGEGEKSETYSFGTLTTKTTHGYAVAYVYYPCAD